VELCAELEAATRNLGDTAPRRIPVARARLRVPSIDLLRGLVMVIMALDHAREFFTSVPFDPTDLGQTTPALFLTRWITHFCAPVFVLLAGTSAWVAGRRRRPAEQSWLLLSRGLWLIVLEFTVVNLGWYFNFRYESGFVGQVIWAIGLSMIALAALIHLPRAAIAMIAVALIGGHNLLDRFDAQLGESLWYAILHVQRPFPALHFTVLYPVLPWIGVMALGYVIGPVLQQPRAERNGTLISLGIICCTAFVMIRLAGLYGDPSPWTALATPTLSGLSLLNTTKYPPSLLYLLMTLGPALLAIPLLDRLQGRSARVLSAFGRAPLFFYVGHIYLIHLLTVVIGVLSGFSMGQMTVLFLHLPPGFGFSLPVVYLIWIGVVAVMYRPTKWFGELKAKGKAWWWGYL
jgi:uncharacterized membrane protein